LNEPVTAGAVCIRSPDIFGQLRRLRVAQHRDTDCVIVDVPAPNAIERVGLLARPAAQIESACNALLLFVEVLEQRHKLVTLDQKPH